MSRPSQKLRRQPSKRDQVEALPGKFGSESTGDLQGCNCERRCTPHQCTPLDVPSNTAPDSQGLARESHGLQMSCPMPLWENVPFSLIMMNPLLARGERGQFPLVT